MNLSINTASTEDVVIAIEDGGKTIKKKKFQAQRRQAEKLLPAISKLLESAGLSLEDIKSISVCNQGGSFTSLRIGIITANALAYALGIPVTGFDASGRPVPGNEEKHFSGHGIVVPHYDRAPNIGISKKKLLS